MHQSRQHQSKAKGLLLKFSLTVPDTEWVIMLSNAEWTIKHCYMQQLLSCANLHIALFPQIIIILCQQSPYSCSLFLRLASFTRNGACTNNALGVHKRSRTRQTQNRGSLFLVHCFMQSQCTRRDFHGIEKEIPYQYQSFRHWPFFWFVPITCLFPLFSLLISWILAFASLGAVSALTLYSVFLLRTIGFDILQIKNPLVVILSHFQPLLSN